MEDIECVVNLGHYHNSVVIVPDRHEHGTNLLMVRPPGLIPYSFGEDSFATHQRLAREAGATVLVHRSERTALDLDTPDDLMTYHALAHKLAEPLLEPADSNGWMLVEDSINPHRFDSKL
jgi:2-phospho-L-lactate guanylyltransferase (CobY/MobA/RfbA family)